MRYDCSEPSGSERLPDSICSFWAPGGKPPGASFGLKVIRVDVNGSFCFDWMPPVCYNVIHLAGKEDAEVVLLLKAAVIFVVYWITWYLFGLLCSRLFFGGDSSPAVVFLSGFFFHALIFMAFAIPMKWNQVPLHMIARIWGTVWAVFIFLILVLFRKNLAGPLLRVRTFIGRHRKTALFLTVFVLAQVIFVELFGRWSSSTNPAEYIGYVTTSLFTDFLGTTDGRTGYLREVFDYRLFTETFLDHSAVVSKLFDVHPLIEIRWVIPACFLIMGDLAIWFLACFVMREQRARCLFFAVYEGAVGVMTGGYLQSGFYIYFRNYEGKDVYTAILVPVLLAIFWKMYEKPDDRKLLGFGLLCVAGSFPFTGTGLYVVPVAALLALVPCLFGRAPFRAIVRNVIVLSLPCIFYAAYYMAIKSGVLVLTI